jgi:hypothetical protein
MSPAGRGLPATANEVDVDGYNACRVGRHENRDVAGSFRSRRNRLPYQVERTILGIKREHPSWSAKDPRQK